MFTALGGSKMKIFRALALLLLCFVSNAFALIPAVSGTEYRSDLAGAFPNGAFYSSMEAACNADAARLAQHWSFLEPPVSGSVSGNRCFISANGAPQGFAYFSTQVSSVCPANSTASGSSSTTRTRSFASECMSSPCLGVQRQADQSDRAATLAVAQLERGRRDAGSRTAGPSRSPARAR